MRNKAKITVAVLLIIAGCLSADGLYGDTPQDPVLVAQVQDTVQDLRKAEAQWFQSPNSPEARDEFYRYAVEDSSFAIKVERALNAARWDESLAKKYVAVYQEPILGEIEVRIHSGERSAVAEYATESGSVRIVFSRVTLPDGLLVFRAATFTD